MNNATYKEFEEWAMMEISKRHLPTSFIDYQAVMNAWDNAGGISPDDEMLSCAKGTLIQLLDDGVHSY